MCCKKLLHNNNYEKIIDDLEIHPIENKLLHFDNNIADLILHMI